MSREPAAQLLAGAALPAGSLEHLLVLLLAHALTALLDQRTHEVDQPSFERSGRTNAGAKRRR